MLSWLLAEFPVGPEASPHTQCRGTASGPDPPGRPRRQTRPPEAPLPRPTWGALPALTSLPSPGSAGRRRGRAAGATPGWSAGPGFLPQRGGDLGIGAEGGTRPRRAAEPRETTRLRFGDKEVCAGLGTARRKRRLLRAIPEPAPREAPLRCRAKPDRNRGRRGGGSTGAAESRAQVASAARTRPPASRTPRRAPRAAGFPDPAGVRTPRPAHSRSREDHRGEDLGHGSGSPLLAPEDASLCLLGLSFPVWKQSESRRLLGKCTRACTHGEAFLG